MNEGPQIEVLGLTEDQMRSFVEQRCFSEVVEMCSKTMAIGKSHSFLIVFFKGGQVHSLAANVACRDEKPIDPDSDQLIDKVAVHICKLTGADVKEMFVGDGPLI